MLKRIQIIDSHTGGEPTRVVLQRRTGTRWRHGDGAPENFREQHDQFRSAVVNEPRGSDVLVGALLVEPSDKTCVAGVIFFNNVGVLAMCGHGTIGLIVTLAHLGRIEPGEHRIETCVGVVTATLHADGEVSVANVASYRKAKAVTVDVPGIGKVTGDIAWGGNWFFLIEEHGLDPLCERGSTHGLHLARAAGDQCAGFSRNRSCRTLRAGPERRRRFAEFRPLPRQGLRPIALRHRHERETRVPRGGRQIGRRRGMGARQHYRQRLSRHLPARRRKIIPIITGTAFVNSEATLLLNENDPFCWGIRQENL